MAYCGQCGASVQRTPCPFCGADDQGLVQNPVLPQVPDGRLPQAPQRRDPAKLVLLGVIGAALLGVVAFLVLAKFGEPAPVTQAVPAGVGSRVVTAPMAPVPTTPPPPITPPTTLPTAPPAVDPQASAKAVLIDTRAADLSRFSTNGQWLIQLNSKWNGLVDPAQTAANGTHQFFYSDILIQYQDLRSRFGDRVLLVQSVDLGKQISYAGKPAGEPLWVVVYDPGNLGSVEDARSWCRASFPGLTASALANVCYPKQASAPHS